MLICKEHLNFVILQAGWRGKIGMLRQMMLIHHYGNILLKGVSVECKCVCRNVTQT